MLHKLIKQQLTELILEESKAPDLKSWQLFLEKLTKSLEHSELTQEENLNNLKMKVQNYVLATSRQASLAKVVRNAVHDINTPLAVIQIRTDQLLEVIQNEENNKDLFLKSISSIESAAQRIGTMVLRLRTVAKSSAADPIIPNSIGVLVDESLGLLKDLAASSAIQIEVAKMIEAEVLCRPIDFSNLLSFILMNSIEAIKDKPERWIRIEIEIENQFALIHITDSGSGIPHAIEKQIMRPFTTTKSSEHLGLGLWMAQQLAQDMGGKLTFNSQSKNTQFTVTLPLATSN